MTPSEIMQFLELFYPAHLVPALDNGKLYVVGVLDAQGVALQGHFHGLTSSFRVVYNGGVWGANMALITFGWVPPKIGGAT